jgi:hypothetical protein
MALVENGARRVALSEHVTVSVVPLVEVMSVAAVEALHHRGQVVGRPLEEQVVVRSHQAVREALDTEARREPSDEP